MKLEGALAIAVLEDIKGFVQGQRESGETDLRTTLWYIDRTIRSVQDGTYFNDSEAATLEGGEDE